jgi:hypothetical protein
MPPLRTGLRSSIASPIDKSDILPGDSWFLVNDISDIPNNERQMCVLTKTQVQNHIIYIIYIFTRLYFYKVYYTSPGRSMLLTVNTL